MTRGAMNRGAILFEALVALTLLAVSFLCVCQVGAQVGSIQRVHLQRNRAEAAIKRQFEILRAADFATLPARNGLPFDWNLDVDADGKNDQTTIQVIFDQPSLANVVLSVVWGQGNSPKRITRAIRVADRRGAGA